MSSQPETVLKVSQVLNSALSASVVICLAQALPELLKSTHSSQDRIASAFCAMLVIAYNLKQYVDEYRSFENAHIEDFSLARTVFFSTLSYLALAASGYSIHIPNISVTFIIAYFVILIVWSLSSIAARFTYKDSSANTDKLRRRMLWVLVYSFCAAVVGTLLWAEKLTSGFHVMIAASLITVAYFLDVRDCKTFDRRHQGGV